MGRPYHKIGLESECFATLAEVHAAAGRAEAARCLAGAGAALEEIHAPPPFGGHGAAEAARAARLGLGEAEFTAAWEAGRALSLAEAIAFALETPELESPSAARAADPE